MPATHQTRLAVEFLEMVCDGRIDAAYANLVAPTFRHHNPYFAGDADSLRRGMAENLAKFPGKAITIHRTLEDGDTVAAFSHVRLTPESRGYAISHWFRFENDRIAELWESSMEIPAETINSNGMF
jgi:predicted SnoaL-like aldol condensation-catalyzing enzyme